MSKKRIYTELSHSNEDVAIEELNNHPNLINSLNAISFMRNNPLILNGQNSEQIFKELLNYIIFIFKKFFSNCSLYYCDDENFICIDDNTINFFIKSKIEDLNINYTFFVSFLEKFIKQALDNINFDALVNFRVDIDEIEFLITIDESLTKYHQNRQKITSSDVYKDVINI